MIIICKKNRVLSWFFCVVFLFCASGCDPIEAISDTYGDIIDEVGSDDNDNDTTVGQVIAQTAFTSPNVATITVAVLDKNGNLMGDNKEVLCQFTDQFSGAVSLQFTRPTAAGQASCGLTNGTNPFSVNFVAISEGVTSNTLSFTLGGDGTTT